jgi:NAD(P)-dependent dehydrogenase (short-subunit alcohol dehydrogenase family)
MRGRLTTKRGCVGVGLGERPVALVTGAAGDIGRAVARRLAEQEWSLALVDHPTMREALDDTRQQCATLGAPVWIDAFDVTEPAGVERSVRACRDTIGVPTALFNNAGYQGTFDRIDRYPHVDARRVFEVNVLGAFMVLSAVSAAMIAGGVAGSIVSSASMAGVTGAPNMSAYSASKAAVIGLTKSAAKDLAPAGIRVNAVSPAFIGPGRMWDNQVASQAAAPGPYYADDPSEVARQMIRMVPLGRYGSTDEVARVVAFLLSDDASYITGINIEISGGSV